MHARYASCMHARSLLTLQSHVGTNPTVGKAARSSWHFDFLGFCNLRNTLQTMNQALETQSFQKMHREPQATKPHFQ